MHLCLIKNKRIFIIIIIALAIFAVGGIFYNSQVQSPEQKPQEVDSSQPQVQNQEDLVSLTILSGDQEETFTLQHQQSLTAYELLEKIAEKENITLQTKEYDFGIMIEQIGEKKNTEGGKNWIFYIDEEMANKGADQVELEPGEEVEFRYEESPF